MIQITCKGNSAICTRTERLTSGMVGLQCEFVFDGAWDGLAKTAVFTAGNEKRDVLLTGDTCTVPWEVLKTAGYQLVIGVYGTNAEGTLIIPTCYAMCGSIGPGADPSGDESTDPTLPVWGQMQGMIGNLENLATASKDNLVSAINDAAQSGGSGGAVALDTTLTQSGKAADAKAVGDALAGKQPSGNYVQSVNGTAPDENGNVEVEGSGGGGDSWELIYYGEITEDIGSVIVDKDSNGNAFSLKEYKLVITTVAAAENPNSGYSWYTHNDDIGAKGPFYTISGAVGGRTLVFDGKLCGNCWWCQYITDTGNTAAQGSRSVLCPDGQDSGPSAVPVYKLKLAANSGNTCGAGSKVALFGVRA